MALRRRSRILDEIGADMKQKGVFGFCVPRRFFPLPLSPAFSRFQKPPNVKKNIGFISIRGFSLSRSLPLSPAFSRIWVAQSGPICSRFLILFAFHRICSLVPAHVCIKLTWRCFAVHVLCLACSGSRSVLSHPFLEL